MASISWYATLRVTMPDVQEAVAPDGPPERVVVGLVSRVRREGVPVPLGAAVEYGRALAALGSTRPLALYWAGRATLVRRPDDIAPFDRAFAAFFGAEAAPAAVAVPVRVELQVDAADGDEPGDAPEGDDDREPEEVRALRWSATEVLRHKDLAACSADELDEAHRLMADLRVHAALRRSRRHRPTRRRRGRPDLRRTVRRALRTGGEVVRPAATEPSERPRRLVLLLDVSGSMEPYARALARFAHAAVAARRRGQVEVFALGTRVTRISHQLATHDPDEALRRAADAVADWAGGTRLGDGLRRFNDRWGVRGLGRGAVVVVLSDGWDRGDPAVLGTELARLRRVAHRLVWVNPLKASPGYAPLAQGMAAALPHVDEFLEGHSVASLEALAEVVAR
ncbi:MAG TPA: VWA domain-containing protein [Acidimicrobiales bacterium]|jgi:uncharacterized protein with von Willebrand factor type A (vWA) domain|nr:VWA domain-containing protein [Acidimicrobiales bacterium]